MSGRHRLAEHRQRIDTLRVAAAASETALTTLLATVVLVGVFSPAHGAAVTAALLLGGCALLLAVPRVTYAATPMHRRFLS